MGFSTCKELPLKLFCEIANDGTVELLGVDNPEETWDNIFDEFIDISKNREVKNMVAKRRKLMSYLAEYELLRILLTRAYIKPDKEIIEKIQTFKVKVQPTRESIKQGFERIKLLQSKAMSLQIELEMASQGGDKLNFDKMMAVLHKNHFAVNEDITVSRYVECINLL